VTYLASKVVMPLAQILFFTFLGMYASGSSNADFYVIGNAIQLTAVSGIFGVTMSIGGDRLEGTLPYLLGAPANRLAMILGRAFMHILDGMLGVFLAFGWGAVLLGLDLRAANPAALLLVILVTTISTAGLGLLLGCLSLITRNVMFVNNSVYFLLLIFSGANVPIDRLPAWMQAISWSLPLTRGVASARRVIAGGTLRDVIGMLASELLLGAVYVLLGYALFHWFEVEAKRKGTLEAI
jgi:ABC-2 type transport system permease protein